MAGDIVDVTVRAGGQQQRFSYRVVSTRPAGTAKRVLVIAAEDYTGVSPNKTPYDTAPRYASLYAASVPAAGYTVETYDIDNPPAGPTAPRGRSTSRSSASCSTSMPSSTRRATTSSRRT